MVKATENGEQRDKVAKDPELKKYCKSQKIKDMLHENMISSGNIALTGASFQSFSEQRYSFLAANLGAYEKSLGNTYLGTYILKNSDDYSRLIIHYKLTFWLTWNFV